MGSILIEADDIETYATTVGIPFTNSSTICTTLGTSSAGIFFENPLNYSVPLLLMQSSLVSSFILLTYGILKPLGQSLIVSQILGGIILGQSLLGLSKSFTRDIFPLRGFVLLDGLSAMGFMFYFFLIGIRMDIWIFKKINRKTFTIGFFTYAFALILSMTSAFVLARFIGMEPLLISELPFIAEAESALAFPIIAQFLSELKIINSEFGRVAMSSSMVSGMCSFCVVTLSVFSHQTPSERLKVMTSVWNGLILGMIIILAIRPTILWMIQRNRAGPSLKESDIIVMFTGVLVTGFCSHALNFTIGWGPLLLGMTVPTDPRVGPVLLEKLDLITLWLFMPFIFLKTGLVVDVSSIKFKHYMIVQFIALMAALGKFAGAFLSALIFRKMPVKDAISLGLVMTVQGLFELVMFKMLKAQKAIDEEVFTIICISMVIITGIVTPIIRCLYDSSRRYAVYMRRSVMQLRRNADLRVLVCIHDEEDVPAAINLLDTFNPTHRSPLTIYLLHLVELVGRATPLLISHKQTKRSTSGAAGSSQSIINAFRFHEHSHQGLISVHPFTAIAPKTTMYDNVCEIALAKKTSLVIVPFYKKFTGSVALKPYDKENATDITTSDVLEKAPCSVAILVDRGLVKTLKPILENWPTYRVAVLFLGGADDWEALALGTRMTGHPNISLTIIRLLHNEIIAGDDMERTLDEEVLSDYRYSMAENYRVKYVQEVVMDGSETLAVIRSMDYSYELIMVGRNHNNESPLLSGLAQWNEHNELGAIGDVLASPDFMGKTTVLVVQKHNNK